MLGLVLWVAPAARAATAFTRTEDVIYGRKAGMALTLDVFQPAHPNGAAIFVMVSGGFFSDHSGIIPAFYQTYLERGYTVFAVVHGSQPRFIIPEIEQDIHRAIRFVRHNASRWGLATNEFGITGFSSGGHLSLTIGTQGGPGKADAPDPVDRESSAVQAVACFSPPTDFLDISQPNEDWMAFPPARQFEPAFGPLSKTPEGRQKLGREISPIYFVTAHMAPTLVMHGDADPLVPIYQAKLFQQKCQAAGATYELIVKPGAGHGWPGMDKDVTVFADWFDQYLRGLPAKHGAGSGVWATHP